MTDHTFTLTAAAKGAALGRGLRAGRPARRGTRWSGQTSDAGKVARCPETGDSEHEEGRSGRGERDSPATKRMLRSSSSGGSFGSPSTNTNARWRSIARVGGAIRAAITRDLPGDTWGTLSHSTVKHHLARARGKVGATTTAQLVCAGSAAPWPAGPDRSGRLAVARMGIWAPLPGRPAAARDGWRPSSAGEPVPEGLCLRYPDRENARRIPMPPRPKCCRTGRSLHGRGRRPSAAARRARRRAR